MTRFALKTLFADRGKLLVAVLGVVFALVLVNLQGGLYFGLMEKASLLINIADADIWVGHRFVENVDLPKHIHESFLSRIKGLPEVANAEPYIITGGSATLPNGGYEDLWIIGCEPDSCFGTPPFEVGTFKSLSSANRISIDELDRKKLGLANIGDVIEIDGKRAKIAAKTRGVLGFMTTPNVFTNLDSARYFGKIPDGYCSYFLVRATPGTDVKSLSSEIQKRLPGLDVYTANEFRRLSQDYWMKRTGIGISFGTATVLGVLVGLVMVAQSLYALALDHLSDYATLRAMGANQSSIAGVVFVQSLMVAAMGSLIGISLVVGITRNWSDPMAPIDIPAELVLGSVGLVIVICLLGSVLPLLRIRKVDPIMVLQG